MFNLFLITVMLATLYDNNWRAPKIINGLDTCLNGKPYREVVRRAFSETRTAVPDERSCCAHWLRKLVGGSFNVRGKTFPLKFYDTTSRVLGRNGKWIKTCSIFLQTGTEIKKKKKIWLCRPCRKFEPFER